MITHQDIETDMNTLEYVEQSINDHLSGMWECKVVIFREEPPFPSDVERLCGDVVERTKYLDMNGYKWKGNNLSIWSSFGKKNQMQVKLACAS